MPRLLRTLRRPTPIGLALTAFDVWRRLPPAQRRRLAQVARTHGPRVAASLMKSARARRARRGSL